MFPSRTFRFLLAALCMLCLTIPGYAAEVDAGSVYCFGTGDFSEDTQITGICITELPDARLGTLTLGNRVIRSGDILTAQQTEQMIFSPLVTDTNQTAQIRYLPIYENRVAPCTAMTISIRGKEDKAPVAEDAAAETYKNIPTNAKLKASDPEGQALTYTITRQPKRGTVTIGEDGSFTYSPKKNKVGVDSFAYTATDPAGHVSREATVTITILKPTVATQYTDTAGRACSFTAEWMKHTGIFVGETLGNQPCFQPDKPVTRGEFVTMLVKALDVPTDEQLTYSGYTDEIPTWLQPYLAAAVRSGLTEGLSDQQTFHANAAITGADAAAMIENALDRADVISVEADTELTREQVSQILYQCVQNLNQTNFDTLV